MSSSRRSSQGALFELELVEEPVATPAAEPPPEPPRPEVPRSSLPAAASAPFRVRLFAGLVDLGVHVAVAALVVLGTRMLGVAPGISQAPAFALLVLVFSLFYIVVPLAFWGKSPGMAAVGIACQAGDDLPLTFAEALRRWLGELVTVAALGLPGLLALGGGRSLADRWSSSRLVIE